MSAEKIIHLGKRTGRFCYKLARFLMLCGIAYYILYPIIEKCLLAFMTFEDLYDRSVGFLPRHWTLYNISSVMESIKFSETAFHSLLICVISVVTQAASCTLVGYGFARFQFRGKRLLFAAVILVMVVPAEVTIIPMYLNYRYFDVFGIIKLLTGKPLNLLNSLWPFALGGLTCMGLRCGLYIYLMRQFYRGVPKELEDAAAIDGAGYFATFVRVMLPIGRPMIFVVAVLSLVWQWTDSFYPSWFYSSGVLAVEVANLPDNLGVVQNLMNTAQAGVDPKIATMLNGVGTLLLTVPLILVYIFTNKNLVGGVERSGLVE